MSPTATFHAQLASIMEVLANTAVAEICELVDSGYAVLQLEISRSRKENEVLRRKLRLMELRAVRTTALRAATGGSGTVLLHGSSRPRVHLHGGYEQKRTATPTRSRADDIGSVQSRPSNQETPRLRDPSPPPDSGQETTSQTLSAGGTTPVIKVEDEDENESWSPAEPDRRFCRVAEGQTTETEASSSLIKQEEEDEEDGGSVSWTSGEVSSTSTQHALNANQRPETGAYDSVMFELQHSSHASQNPVGTEPSGSSALTPSENVSADSGTCFSFSRSELSPSASEQPVGFHNQQQRVLQRAPASVQSAFIMVDGCLVEDRARRNDSGGKTFVCNCCGKTLACLKNLKTHMRVHTGEKPFVCALCGKRFSDSSNLKRHQSVHTGEKRYGCVHCGKRFAQSGSLKVHMSVHRDCKQFRCSFCGKTFTSGGHLRRHIAAHTGEKQLATSSL